MERNNRNSMQNGGTHENPQAALVSQRRRTLRQYKPGRCILARKRLNAVFNMRKYYRAVFGLCGIEAIFVIVRMIIETETLRYPPGITYVALLNTQLAFFCISLPILVLFLIEQPFKWWAFGTRRFCKSVLAILDALICIACFSLNVYNIHTLAAQPTTSLASARQLDLCGSTHITHPPDTAHTFAIAMGIIIVFRFWCIEGYLKKSIQIATRDTLQKLDSVQHLFASAQERVQQLESMLHEYSNPKYSHTRGSVRTSTAYEPQVRSSARHSTRDSKYSRYSQANGEPV